MRTAKADFVRIFFSKANAGRVACTLALTVIPMVSRAQDASSPTDSPSQGQRATSDTKPAGKTGVGGLVDAAPVEGPAPTGSALTQVQALGTGGWLTASASPLRWGSLYIGSLEFNQGYDQFNGGPSTNPGVFHSSLFQTNVTYDVQLSRSRFAFQWQPQLGTINGQFMNNLSNQNVSADYATLLTPRLSMHIQDHFGYTSVRNLFFDNYLYAGETVNNKSTQNTFLDGPGTWLTDAATVTLDYHLSAANDIAFSPTFNYAYEKSTSLSGSQSPSLVGSTSYGASVHFTHLLSQTKSVGVFYLANVVKFGNLNGNVIYHTVGGSFVDQITQSVSISSSFGLSTSVINGPARYWSLYADAELRKKFHNSSAALTYSRGLSLDQYASQYYTDRADLSYTFQLTRRVESTVGAGYQHAGGQPAISGEYESAQIGYHFLPSLSMSLNYAHRNQSGDTTQVFTETRNTVFLTLRWEPPRFLK